MKYLALVSVLTFSLSALATDLSFGSFEVEETKVQPIDQPTTDLSFASFENADSQGRAIASVEENTTPAVDPVAFGSFE